MRDQLPGAAATKLDVSAPGVVIARVRPVAVNLDVEDADAVMVSAGDYGAYRAARCNLERGSGAARRIPRGGNFLVCRSEGDLASDLDKGTRTELDDGVRSSSSQGVVNRVLITRADTSSRSKRQQSDQRYETFIKENLHDDQHSEGMWRMATATHTEILNCQPSINIYIFPSGDTGCGYVTLMLKGVGRSVLGNFFCIG